MININTQISLENLVFFVPFFIAADKLQYQSLDAVNKEGMFRMYKVSIIISVSVIISNYNILFYHR